MKTPAFVAPALAAALLLTGCAGTANDSNGAFNGSSTGNSPALPASTAAPGEAAADGDSMPPWPAPTDVSDRVARAGLDLGPMGTAEHYHPHLRILVGDTEVPVAANIGVDPASGAMSALHTHEGDGTIHIEADTESEVFTLGQFFTEWGVTLTANQVGGAHATGGTTVKVTSNGATVPGDPNKLRLEPDQQIVVSVR